MSSSEYSKHNKALADHLPRIYKKKRYYTWADIECHGFAYDLWVVVFGKVLDLTPLVQKHIKSSLCQPIIDFAGKDISHWFCRATNNPKTRVDPATGCLQFYCPNGRYSGAKQGTCTSLRCCLGLTTSPTMRCTGGATSST